MNNMMYVVAMVIVMIISTTTRNYSRRNLTPSSIRGHGFDVKMEEIFNLT
jgi:hypothetical protein